MAVVGSGDGGDASDELTTLDMLQQLDIGVSHKATMAFADAMQHHTLQPDEYLLMQGDPCNSFHLIVSGEVDVVSHGLAGREIVYNTLGRGASIGELTIIDGGRRTASIRAAHTTELLTISRDDFLVIARTHADVGLWLADRCAWMARTLHLRSDERAFGAVGPRLAALLLTLLPPTPATGAVIHATQQSLANRLGATREWVNKHLREWRAADILDVGRGKVTVFDPARLAAAAQMEPQPTLSDGKSPE